MGYRVSELSFVWPNYARNRTDFRCPAFRISDRRNSVSAQLVNVLIFCFGLYTLALSGRARGGIRAFAFAILVSATIAGYSLINGIGVRVPQNPWPYIP